MYSSIKKLLISDNTIQLNDVTVTSKSSLYEFFNTSLKCQSQDKTMTLNHENILIKFTSESRIISLELGGTKIAEFYAPRELRYRIAKDIQCPDTQFQFNLNYRKHFRTKHSKSQATIQYFNFEYPEMLTCCPEFMFEVKNFYDRARKFSEGEERRPTLLIVANIIDDAFDKIKFDVTFRIVKSNKVVYNKKQFNYCADLPVNVY